MMVTVEPHFVCYGRLYFEQKNLERYGWSLGPLTPVISSLKFFTDVEFLPYKFAAFPWQRYDCSAGYCLPGDPVPLRLYPPEISATGFAAEASVVVALIAILP